MAKKHESEPRGTSQHICVWTEDDSGNWDTGCGQIFIINEGTPKENQFHFCCFCGGKLAQEPYTDSSRKE